MSISRLPHKEPIIFIDSLQQQTENSVTLKSSFPIPPSLAMLCEASAQGTSFFPLSPNCTIGFVSSFRNVTLLQPCTTLTPLITITILHSFNDAYLFKFEVFDHSIPLATGEVTMFYTAT